MKSKELIKQRELLDKINSAIREHKRKKWETRWKILTALLIIGFVSFAGMGLLYATSFHNDDCQGNLCPIGTFHNEQFQNKVYGFGLGIFMTILMGIFILIFVIEGE